MKPIGILGGTFDPIHYGHLRLAEEMLELAGLEEIRFMPAGNPPHRDAPAVSAEHRSNMVKLAILDQRAFALDEREAKKSAKCYTADTLKELRSELGNEKPLCLLMGGDAFSQLHTWHEWESLFDLAHIAVGHRPGFTMEIADQKLYEHYSSRRCGAKELSQKPAGGIAEFEIPKLEISATMIRSRVAKNRSIRYLLPESVANYIHNHHLYETC